MDVDENGEGKRLRFLRVRGLCEYHQVSREATYFVCELRACLKMCVCLRGSRIDKQLAKQGSLWSLSGGGGGGGSSRSGSLLGPNGDLTEL